MKFKKTWIFWICYYGVAIVANVLAAVLLREKWNFNGWSAFPIVYIAVLVFLSWYYPSKLHYKRIYEKNELSGEPQWYQHTFKKGIQPTLKFLSVFFAICVPFYFMFIHVYSFFHKYGKIQFVPIYRHFIYYSVIALGFKI